MIHKMLRPFIVKVYVLGYFPLLPVWLSCHYDTGLRPVKLIFGSDLGIK